MEALVGSEAEEERGRRRKGREAWRRLWLQGEEGAHFKQWLWCRIRARVTPTTGCSRSAMRVRNVRSVLF